MSTNTNIDLKVDNCCTPKTILRTKTGPIGAPGQRGARGFIGPQGVPGTRGSSGKTGSMGAQGYQGARGVMGNMGLMGEQGPPGQTGSQGSQGMANFWYVGETCDSFTHPRAPIHGDYLLSISDCTIYVWNTEGMWETTENKFNCIDSDRVYDSLRDLPNPTETQKGDCVVSMTLPSCSSIFQSGLISVTEVTLFSEKQATPIGTFSNPSGLATILAPYGWSYQKVEDTHIYILNHNIGETDPTGKLSYFIFSNLDVVNLDTQCQSESSFECEDFQKDATIMVKKADGLYWVDPVCILGETALQGGESTTPGPQGATGAIGPLGPQGDRGETGPVSCEKVVECVQTIQDPDMTCEYAGIQDLACDDFLNPITATYLIATALNSPDNIVNGPVSFSDQATYSIALNTLNIVVVENLVTVTSSSSPINRIYYYNSGGQVVGSISLTQSKCCPSDLSNPGTKVLSKLPTNDDLAWVDAQCLLDYQFDLQQELGQLPEIQPYKINYQLDASLPFRNNNESLFPYPWTFQQLILAGDDVTEQYSNTQINSIVDFTDILKENGWTSATENSLLYVKVTFSETEVDDITSSYKLTDANNTVFFCRGIAVEQTETITETLKVMYQLDSGYSVVGPVTTIFDAVPLQENLTFTCTTTALTDTIIRALDDNANLKSPYSFTQIVLGDEEQAKPSTQFSTRGQLETLLTNMGWVNQGTDIYTISQILDNINHSSYFIFRGASASTPTMQINLLMSCKGELPEGTPSGNDQLILARNNEGEYYWTEPTFLGGGDLIINSSVINQCPTAVNPLEVIPYCNLTPTYDLTIVINCANINLIKNHFDSDGPFWIVGYKLDNNNLVLQEKNVSQPFSLLTVSQAMTELGWAADPPVANITSSTEEVSFSLNNSTDMIMSVCFNLVGNNGDELPFNYAITVNDITGQSCPGLSSDSKLLLKGATGYCYVDVDCIIPHVPPQLNIIDELNDIVICSGDDNLSTYTVCVSLDDCDVQRIIGTYGTTDSILITEYRLLDNSKLPLTNNNNLGPNFSLQTLIQLLQILGWSSTDITARPVEMTLTSNDNITYLVFNRVGGDPNVPPYPYLIGTSCTEIASCPSTNPNNQVLIRTPINDDDTTNDQWEICWTNICPIKGPVGDQGPQGNAGGVGAAGPQGAPGGAGSQGAQGAPGSGDGSSGTGAQGSQGYQGAQGAVSGGGNAEVGDPIDIVAWVVKEYEIGGATAAIETSGTNINLIGNYVRHGDIVDAWFWFPYSPTPGISDLRTVISFDVNPPLPTANPSYPINYQFSLIESVIDGNPDDEILDDGDATSTATISPFKNPALMDPLAVPPINQSLNLTTTNLSFKLSHLDTTNNTERIDVHIRMIYNASEVPV